MHSPNQSEKSVPDLSAIIVTADSYQQIRKAVLALSTQTVCDRVELVIVCPFQESLGLVEAELSGFHSVQVVEIGKMTTTSASRVAAIRAAAAPVVALCEDHAYPEPGWAEAMIAAHKQPWAGVGSALTNANPGATSWVAMVMDYGRWVDPVASGVIDDIPGHNSSWKRSLLLEYGSDLEWMLPAPTFLNWDLRSKGHQLYLESGAKMRHLQVSNPWACAVEQFYVARMFPSERSRKWPWYRRLFYICAMPVLLARNLRGWLGHFRRIDPTGKILARSWPVLLVAVVVWGIGEIIGYSVGIGSAEERTLCFDTDRASYLSRRDRSLMAAIGQQG